MTFGEIFSYENKTSAKCNVLRWFLFLLGCGLCIFQASFLITEYRRYPVTEKTTAEVQIPLTMPSVTICSNIPCREYLFLRPEYAISKDIEQREIPKSDLVLNRLALLNDSERFTVGYNSITYGPSVACGFGDCKIFYTNNLYYGNCVTYNGGTPPEEFAGEMRVFGTLLLTYEPALYSDITRSRSFVAIIHEPDTAPVLTNPENHIIGYPGDEVTALISKSEFNLKPSPYSSQCVERNYSLDLEFGKFHQQPKTQFLYTMEECIQNCLQNLTIHYCHCLLPKIPFESNENNLTICYDCPYIPREELQHACGCKKPCRYSEYSAKIVTQTGKLWSDEYKKATSGVTNSTFAEDTNLAIKTFGVCLFHVKFFTNVVEVTSELAEYELESVLGLVGGTVGLYLGLSIISLFETIFNQSQLIFKVVTKSCTCFSRKK